MHFDLFERLTIRLAPDTCKLNHKLKHDSIYSISAPVPHTRRPRPLLANDSKPRAP
jgi:hypothetical protein